MLVYFIKELVMEKRIVFRGVDHSDIAETYANKQLKKIEKFLAHEPTPVTIDLIFEPSKLRQHSRVELLIKSPHYDLVSHYEHEGVEFYQALDHVIDCMYRQLIKAKERRVEERKEVGRHEDFKKQR